MLRSRSYLGLLVLAATIGLPVSAVADGFLALVRSSPRGYHGGACARGVAMTSSRPGT